MDVGTKIECYLQERGKRMLDGQKHQNIDLTHLISGPSFHQLLILETLSPFSSFLLHP